MAKQILCGFDGVKALERGVDAVANAVKLTIGPKGRNAVLERKFGTPLITNDGVTIAKEITLSDPFENLGVNLIKEVSIKTNDVAGDGTTTACVLAQSIVKEGIKNCTAGANPVILKRGILKGIKACVKHLKEISKPINDYKEIFQIASISGGDEEIGQIISDAFEKVGKDGVITVEDGKTLKTELKIVEGMQFDRGYLSPYMVTDSEKMVCELNDAYILITDYKINNMQEIVALLEGVANSGRPLLIIAEEIENDVLSALVLNKLRGAINVVCVKAPAYADRRKAILQDIALITGGQYVSQDFGISIKEVGFEHLGKAKKIKVTKDSTTISGGEGDEKSISDRIEQIKGQISLCENDFDREKLEERLAKLTGGVAVICVGSATEIEMQEKKLRIEDAISATKSAVEEGIVAGGGIALISCMEEVAKVANDMTGDEKTGCNIVLSALQEPLKLIANNSGVDGGIVLYNVLQGNKENPYFGYNALTNEYVDMIKSGIIDPTKVTRSALENAGSVASTLLTTDCLICDQEQTTTPTQAVKNAYGMY